MDVYQGVRYRLEQSEGLGRFDNSAVYCFNSVSGKAMLLS